MIYGGDVMVIFNELINNYLSGLLDMETFHKQIKQLFYNLLSDYGFLDWDMLMYYPFLSELMDEDCYNVDNLSLSELLNDIKSILNGEKTYEYSLWINLRSDRMEELHTRWELVKRDGIIKKNIDMIMEKIEEQDDDKTITYEYEKKLFDLFVILSSEGGIAESNSLYVQEYTIESLIAEIDRIFLILLGKQPAYITIKYSEGGVQYVCI